MNFSFVSNYEQATQSCLSFFLFDSVNQYLISLFELH